MNILQVFQKFITQKDCIEHLEKTRWGDDPVCPYCGSGRTGRLQKRHHCHACKTSFSVTVGTIFHGTHLPLQKWFLAISLMLNARKGISALQLSRDLNVNKNTAWRISMQIRRAMKEIGKRKLLKGVVEMEETWIGGRPRKGDGRKPRKRGRGTDKMPVVGAMERGGKVTARAVSKKKMKAKDMKKFVRDFIGTGESTLMTDEYGGYAGMSEIIPHKVIRHGLMYVDGDVHVNSLEGFWALVKRGMLGQFHSVSRKHLQRYLDEFAYRFNLRKAKGTEAFDLTVSRGLGVA